MKRAPPAARWWWVDPRRTFVINRVNRVGSGRQAGRVRGGRETTAAATMALGGRGVSGGVSLQSERSNWEWLEWASPKTFHNVSGRRGISANNGGKSSLSSSSSSSSSSLSFIYLIFFFFLFDFLTISFHSFFFLGGGLCWFFPFLKIYSSCWEFKAWAFSISSFVCECLSFYLSESGSRAVPERFRSSLGAIWERFSSFRLYFPPPFWLRFSYVFSGGCRAVSGQFQGSSRAVSEQSLNNLRTISKQL